MKEFIKPDLKLSGAILDQMASVEVHIVEAIVQNDKTKLEKEKTKLKDLYVKLIEYSMDVSSVN
jgi:hypothetical protein